MDKILKSYQSVKIADVFCLQKNAKIHCGPLMALRLKSMLCGPNRRPNSLFLCSYLLSGPGFEQKTTFSGGTPQVSG